MGCLDGAEVCELVGTFIFNKLKNDFQNNTFGLYRDDDLTVTKGLSGAKIERLKKKNVVKTFKDCGLILTIETNLHTVNYQSTRLHNQLFKPSTNSNKTTTEIDKKMII